MYKWERRAGKLWKRRNGMRVDNRSIFTMRDANRRRETPPHRREKLSGR
jgi:hypothetical protein